MTHKTRGLVLRSVKYGETSLIVTIYTEAFGLQSYIVNGVRINSRKGAGRANHFQPGALLDLVVYQNELSNLQRIKEFGFAYLYQHLFFDIFKNSVALFMVELLLKCVKQPESNPELFYFVEEAFLHLDSANEAMVANYSLYFSVHLAGFFGFRIQDDYSAEKPVLDLQEGQFVRMVPEHGFYIEEPLSEICSHLLKVMRPEELPQVKMNRDTRRSLLLALQNFYALHIPDFGSLRTLPVLQTVFAE